LGNLRCLVINDASRAHSAGDLIANADHEQLERLAPEFGFELDEIPVDYNGLLVDTGDQDVLVDAGFGGPASNLLQELGSLGCGPGTIGIIVITHSDMDHDGGILDDKDQLSFANARHVTAQEAWEHWASVENRSRLATVNNGPEHKDGVCLGDLLQDRRATLPCRARKGIPSRLPVDTRRWPSM
jgi:glyoxylase-like metal-dependent hydrolase (beta-lactamase superfamily II)